MTAFLVIVDNVVANMVVADDEYGLSQGWLFASDYPGVSIGYIWNGTMFVAPPTPPLEIYAIQNEIDFSDKAILRYYIKGMLVPDNWVAYKNLLDAQLHSIQANIPPLPTLLPSRLTETALAAGEASLLLIKDLATTTQKFAPTTGQTITLANTSTDSVAIIQATSDLDELTIILPTEAKARLNQIIRVYSAHTITALSLSSDTGVIILGAPDNLNPNDIFSVQRIDTGVWAKI